MYIPQQNTTIRSAVVFSIFLQSLKIENSRKFTRYNEFFDIVISKVQHAKYIFQVNKINRK